MRQVSYCGRVSFVCVGGTLHQLIPTSTHYSFVLVNCCSISSGIRHLKLLIKELTSMLMASTHFAECCDFDTSLTFSLVLFAVRDFTFPLVVIERVTLSVVAGILTFLLCWLFHNRSKLSRSSCGRCFTTGHSVAI
jgi:hypothetical protein